MQVGDDIRVGRQLFRYGAFDNSTHVAERSSGDDAKVWGSPDPKAFGRLNQLLEDGCIGESHLLAGDGCILGREEGRIVLPHDGFVSARHCQFKSAGGDTWIKDLGSSNGTYLRIRGEANIEHGDYILIGNQMLRIEIV